MPHVDRLLWGSQVWATISQAATRPGRRLIATAYAGKQAAELVPLRTGDIAIVNASRESLRAGLIYPGAVATWLAAGARVFSHEQLHAKVYLLGGCAFVGSANASAHSRDVLLEAALHSDRAQVRQQVRDLVLELTELAAEPLDRDWLTGAWEQYRPPRRSGQRRPPEQEQVLPPGSFRLRYSTWTHDGYTLSAGEQKIVDELSTRGVQVWAWDVEPGHPLRPDDVVVLTSHDDDENPVELWPPMRVLRLGRPRRTSQLVFVRHSKKLAPLPVDDPKVRAAARGLRHGTWVGPAGRARLLALWGLTDHAQQ